MPSSDALPLLPGQGSQEPCMGCRMLKRACVRLAHAATWVLAHWRERIRHPAISFLVTATMLASCISVVVYMCLGDVPVLHGLREGKLRAVVGLVAIAFTLAGDFFPVLLACQSRLHPKGGLEAGEQLEARSTPCTLVACLVWAVLLPVARTVCNAVVLAGFLEAHSTMAGVPHTKVQDCRAVGELVVAVFMVLSVPTYQLGFVSRCITAHNVIRDTANKWKKGLSDLARIRTDTLPVPVPVNPVSVNPVSVNPVSVNPVPFITHFETASAAVRAVNQEYTTTLGVVITVRTSFILAYTALQLIVGSPTSSWVYVIAPALELLNLLGAAATVTQQHHLLEKWASTAAFHVQQRDLRAATADAAGGQTGFGDPTQGSAIRVLVGQESVAYMVGATRLADHVRAHRSDLAIQVWSPLGKFDVTRSYVLRLTVGIGTSLLTLFIKDIIIENLRVAGIVFHQ